MELVSSPAYQSAQQERNKCKAFRLVGVNSGQTANNAVDQRVQ